MESTEERNGTAPLQHKDLCAIPSEEIVASSPSNKSWKGILIAILVILIICSLIILAIYFTSPGSKEINYGKRLSFSDFLNAEKIKKKLIHEWIGSDHFSYVNEDGERMLLNLKENSEVNIMLRTYFEEKKSSPASCRISNDGKFLFIAHNLHTVYRHSTKANYVVYNVENKEFNNEIGPGLLQNVMWSPKEHVLAFVQNNNLYYNEDPLDNSKIVSITSSLPQLPNLRYGTPDWLYEEEILKGSMAYWWSPSGTCIAFLSFNDEKVDSFYIKVYGDHNVINDSIVNLKYPMAGNVPATKNPEVKAFVYRLDLKKTYQIPNPSGIPKDMYIYLVKWIDDNHLLMSFVNRDQNEGWLSMSRNWSEDENPVSWVIYQETVSNGWINMLKQSCTEPLVFSEQRKIYTILNRVTKNTEYRNIAELSFSYTPKTMARKKWSVVADFDFTDILYFDKEKMMYFSAIASNDPKQLHLYKANSLNGEFTCVSCSSSNCSYNNYEFNSNGEFMVESCLGPSVPTYSLLHLERNGSITTLRILINNTELKQFISSKAMPKIEYQKVKIKVNSTHSIELETKMMLPVRLQKEQLTKYPMLIHIYAGPSSQAVTTKFSLHWLHYLTSSWNMIVLQVDGRGTSNRGRLFERAIYKNVGNIEVHDQLLAAEEVSKLHYINQSQIASYGWSYGGFVVGQILGNPNNKLIPCGISVAPVTSFDYYDTAYTERYLGLKEKNPTIYMQTDISRLVKNFHKKKYLLVHGTKDDNVHFLNSVRLLQSLINEDIDVDIMVYPDETHSIRGSKNHLFKKLTTFLMNCLNKTSIDYHTDLFQ